MYNNAKINKIPLFENIGGLIMNGDLFDVTDEEFASLQHELDLEKWYASERAGRDLCGTMSWCFFCVKKEQHPCAKAKMREQLKADEKSDSEPEIADAEEINPEAATVVSEKEPEEAVAESVKEKQPQETKETAFPVRRRKQDAVPAGYVEAVRYRRSFRSRVIQNESVQDVYTELKNYLLSFSGVKARLCKNCENFRVGRAKIAKFIIRGKTLSLYLALNPAEYEDAKYRFEDESERRTHADTPMRLKVKSQRSVKYAKELIADLAKKTEIEQIESVFTDYHTPYRSDEELIAEGYITTYTVLIKEK